MPVLYSSVLQLGAAIGGGVAVWLELVPTTTNRLFVDPGLNTNCFHNVRGWSRPSSEAAMRPGMNAHRGKQQFDDRDVNSSLAKQLALNVTYCTDDLTRIETSFRADARRAGSADRG